MAIDPGQSGGVAVRQSGNTDCHAMPPTQGDLLELISAIKTTADFEGHGVVCLLEEVNGFAGKAQPGSAMFKFGEHFGFTKGVVQALGIRLELVRPQVWQKTFGLGTAARCASKTEWKNKLKAEAQRRFPHLKVTLKTADALLLLDYAMRGDFQPLMNTSSQKGGGREMCERSALTLDPSPPGEGGGPEDYLGQGTGCGQ